MNLRNLKPKNLKEGASPASVEKKGEEKKAELKDEIQANTAFQYEDNDMLGILQVKLQKLNIATTYTPLYTVGNAATSLQTYLDDEKKQHHGARTLLIPYNTGGYHWVGVVLKIDNEEKIQEVIYVDSIKNEAHKETANEVFEMVRMKYDLLENQKKIEWRLLQNDKTSCGPFTIENLLNIAQEKQAEEVKVSDEKNKEIRIEHVKLYHPYDPTFNQRQRNNINQVASPSQRRLWLNAGANFRPLEIKRIAQVMTLINEIGDKNPSIKNEILTVFKNEKKEERKEHTNRIKEKLFELFNSLTTSKEVFTQLLQIIFKPPGILGAHQAKVMITDFSSALTFNDYWLDISYQELIHVGEQAVETSNADVEKSADAIQKQIKMDEIFAIELQKKLFNMIENEEKNDGSSVGEHDPISEDSSPSVQKTFKEETQEEKQIRFKKNDIKLLLKIYQELKLLQEIIRKDNFDKDKIVKLLKIIGQYTNEISWNEEDGACIRNVYGYINRSQKASGTIRKNGIDFEQLAYLSESNIFNDQFSEGLIRDKLLEEGNEDIRNDIALFLQKITYIIQKESPTVLSLLDDNETLVCKNIIAQEKLSFGNELHFITLFTAVLNDRRCLNRIIQEFQIDFNSLNLQESQIDRYYFARILAVTGELIKNLSTIVKPTDKPIKDFFTALSKFRDAIKSKPHLVKKSSQELQSYCDYFKLHQREILNLFVKILDFYEMNQEQDGEIIFLASWENYKILRQNFNKLLHEAVTVDLSKLNTATREVLKKKSKVKTEQPKEGLKSAPSKTEKSTNEQLNSYIEGLAKLYGKMERATVSASTKKTVVNRNQDYEKYLDELMSKYKVLYNTLPENEKENYPKPYDKAAICEKYESSKVTKSVLPVEDAPKTTSPLRAISDYVDDIKQETDFQHQLLAEQKKHGKNKKLTYAREQSIGFTGQYIKDLWKADKNLREFRDLCSEEWNMSMSRTLQARHKVIMHGIFTTDETLASKISQEDILPWLKDVDAVTLVRTYRPLFDQLIRNLSEDGEDKLMFPSDKMVVLGNHLGIAYTRLGFLDDAAKCFENILVLSDESYKTTNIMHNLADVYRYRKNYAKVVTILEEIIRIREKVLEPNHPEIATALNNLGLIYSCLGDHRKATVTYQKAYAMKIKNNDLDSTFFLNLANEYADQKEFFQALQMYNKALNYANLKEDFVSIFHILLSVSVLYKELCEYQLAEKYMLRANEIYETNIGVFKRELGDRYTLLKASLMQDFSGLYYRLGRYQESIDKQVEVLKLKRSKLGVEFPGIGDDYNQMGQAYHFNGEEDKAEEYLTKAIRAYEKERGVDNPAIGLAKNTLGIIYNAKGNLVAAKKLCEEAEKLFLQAGEESNQYIGHLAQCYQTLSNIYIDEKDFEKAKICVGKAVDINNKTRAKDELAKNYGQYGNIFLREGDYKKSEEYCQLSLDMFEEIHGTSSRSSFIITAHFNLVIARSRTKSMEESKTDFLNLVKMIESAKPTKKNQLFLQECYESLGNIYDRQDNMVKFKEYFLKWLQVTRDLYGNNLPEKCWINLFCLADLFHREGEFKIAETYMQQVLSLYKEKNTEILGSFYKKLGLIQQNNAQSYASSGNQQLASIEYEKAMTSYTKAYKYLKSSEGSNSKIINELNGLIKTCQSCFMVFKAMPGFLSHSTARNKMLNETSYHLLKQYKKYIIAYGIPSSEKTLLIKMTNKPGLKDYLTNDYHLRIGVEKFKVDEKESQIIIHVPVVILKNLEAAHLNMNSIPKKSEVARSIADASSSSKPVEEKKDEQTDSVDPLLPPTSFEHQAITIAIANIESTLDEISRRSTLNLKELGMLNIDWLIHAAATGDEWLVRKILRLNSELAHAQDSFGNTALIHAVRGEHVAIIKFLLGKNFNVNVNHQNLLGDTALHIAVAAKVKIEVLNCLLESKPDFQLKNKEDVTALELAKNRNYKIIFEKQSKGSDQYVSKQGFFQVPYASKSGRSSQISPGLSLGGTS